MWTPTPSEALSEIHDVAARRRDNDMNDRAKLTKIETLARHAGSAAPAILRAARSSNDATECMKAVAAVCAARVREAA